MYPTFHSGRYMGWGSKENRAAGIGTWWVDFGLLLQGEKIPITLTWSKNSIISKSFLFSLWWTSTTRCWVFLFHAILAGILGLRTRALETLPTRVDSKDSRNILSKESGLWTWQSKYHLYVGKWMGFYNLNIASMNIQSLLSLSKYLAKKTQSFRNCLWTEKNQTSSIGIGHDAPPSSNSAHRRVCYSCKHL